MIRNQLVSVVKSVVVGLYSFEAFLARGFAKHAYKGLFKAEWNLPPNPEYFDHYIDILYRWTNGGDPTWLERGIYNLCAIKVFGKPKYVVELCCGDGFNTKQFYSTSVGRIYACDYNKGAIRHASKLNMSRNIIYSVVDIRSGIDIALDDLSAQDVEVVIWDNAIAYFSMEENDKILKDIKAILAPNGILSGGTIAANNNKYTHNHKYEFHDMDELQHYLLRFFKHVIVFESIFDERCNLHFYASDGSLPFTESWEHWKCSL